MHATILIIPFIRQGIEALEVIMRDIVDVGAEMKANEQVLDSIYQDLARGEAIVRITVPIIFVADVCISRTRRSTAILPEYTAA